jgi:hypothetical protein
MQGGDPSTAKAKKVAAAYDGQKSSSGAALVKALLPLLFIALAVFFLMQNKA